MKTPLKKVEAQKTRKKEKLSCDSYSEKVPHA